MILQQMEIVAKNKIPNLISNFLNEQIPNKIVNKGKNPISVPFSVTISNQKIIKEVAQINKAKTFDKIFDL
ncbi:hypothetical protein IJ596_06890 [bacterium]|nr:hypothetical protein [bacterium]